MKQNHFNKSVAAWALYDWAESAFFTIILTFVFAAYYTSKIALNKIVGTSEWAFAVAAAGLAVAVVSPLFGAIADHEGRRKPWIFVFTIVATIASALLWFAKPAMADRSGTLLCVALGIVGVEAAQVFYNAMLNDLAPKNYIGRISGWGWSCGYFGGLVSLTIALIVFVKHGSWLGLNEASFQHVRICGPFVAIWLILFSLPFFLITPDRASTGISYRVALRKGLQQLGQTLHTLTHYKEILKFLLARMIYIDGLNTVFAFGGIYAAGTFDMSFVQILEFGIAMNIAAGIGAFSFAWLDDHLGSKPTIVISLVIMIIMATGLLITHSQMVFWILGMGLSVCVGPIQAASRSLLIHIAPAPVLTEMFGLFAFSGKATAFLGPWLVGLLTLYFNSQRAGMSIVVLFLLVGLLLLLSISTKRVETSTENHYTRPS